MKFSVLLILVIQYSDAASKNSAIVLVHGGAGDIPAWRENGKLRGVSLAAQKGYKALIETGNVTSAVEEAGRFQF